MLETNPITKTEAVPETIIIEIQETHTSNLDRKITKNHPSEIWDPENLPYWSDQLAERRLLRRQERALKRLLHNYK